MSDKITKVKAEYISNYFGKEKCQACDMFVKPQACTLVLGIIKPFGHCKYWEAKKKLPVRR